MLKPGCLLAAGTMLALAGCAADDSYYGDSGYRNYSGDRTVDCALPGRDIETSRRECRSLQRRYGRSEAEAERRQRRGRYD